MIYKKFNYVFFIANADYYIYRFSDLYNSLNFRAMHIITQQTDKGVQFFFVPLQTPRNPYAFKDTKNIGLDKIFQNEFPINNPIIFMFRIDDYFWFKITNTNFFQMLRENYPGCKFVCALNNAVQYYQKVMNVFTSEASLKDIHETFDLIVTYNKLDAANYGLTHYEGLYSGVNHSSVEIKSDVFFVGKAKDRFEKILKIYETLMDVGLRCDFWITEVPAKFQKYSDKIHYNNYLSYDKVLEHVWRSNGILEIAEGGNYGLTMRFFEALVYDKIYITDNGYINQEKFRKYPKIICVDNWRDFKIDREKFLAASKLSNNYKGEYSPFQLLAFLESYFNK